MRRHVRFWQVSQDALDHALDALGLEGDGKASRSALLEAYGRLSAYPEVPGMLRALRERGVRAAVLSNGSPAMLAGGFAAAGLSPLLDPVLSVEDAGVFKPAPEVYLLACPRAGPAGRTDRVLLLERLGHARRGQLRLRDRLGEPRRAPPRTPARGAGRRRRDLSAVPDLLGRLAENRR
jgi:2-haloacid dehalogenase